jgi:hypothetical protein
VAALNAIQITVSVRQTGHRCHMREDLLRIAEDCAAIRQRCSVMVERNVRRVERARALLARTEKAHQHVIQVSASLIDDYRQQQG